MYLNKATWLPTTKCFSVSQFAADLQQKKVYRLLVYVGTPLHHSTAPLGLSTLMPVDINGTWKHEMAAMCTHKYSEMGSSTEMVTLYKLTSLFYT